MMFIELFAPRGSLSPQRRRRVAERLVTEVMSEESAQPAVIEASLALSHLVVHEPDTWMVGGRPLEPTEAPRYLVRVSVPNAWRKEMSEHVISRVTRVLAEADDDPHRLYREPHTWVHVVGVPEGSTGAFGPHRFTLAGTPYRVVAVDGTDLNGPGELTLPRRQSGRG